MWKSLLCAKKGPSELLTETNFTTHYGHPFSFELYLYLISVRLLFFLISHHFDMKIITVFFLSIREGKRIDPS